ncbi:ABC-2 transporter permease [Floricoccus penangensis]|uniref:ABC-2 transporter permease n=1 Tax=Floricoccus penangensis TaxID=1859475 RepID=UPI00203DB80E|nr:ABC-2 transporter permease [Floricoccus penangensis]URZ88062.1 ABC-2 transporter permease [Floricoccus penangensis]
MKGVIAKDLYESFLIKKGFLSIFSSYGLCLLPVILGDNIFGPIFAATLLFPFILAPTLIQSSVTMDEKYKYEQYQTTMPVTRKDIVSAKYLLGLIFITFNCLILFILLFTKSNGLDENTVILLGILGIIFSIFSISINYPSLILFGNWGMIPMFILMGIGILIYVIIPISKIIEFTNELITMDKNQLLMGLLTIAVIFLFISYFVTQHFYQKKEFA